MRNNSPTYQLMEVRKTYLSRAVSRALSAEYPVGDPFGGPAYGERNDPVTAVVSFVAANASTIAIVGAVMGVVGAVTGSKELSMLGTVVGLAGGFAASDMGQSLLGDIINGPSGPTANVAADLASSGAAETAANTVSGVGASGSSIVSPMTTGDIPGVQGALGTTDAGGTILQNSIVDGPAKGSFADSLNQSLNSGSGIMGDSAPLNIGTANMSVDPNASLGIKDTLGIPQQTPGPNSLVSQFTSGATGTPPGSETGESWIKDLVSSKEFWGGAGNALGGAFNGLGGMRLADAQLKVGQQKNALEQQMFQTKTSNANSVPSIGNAVAVNPNASPFVSGAPAYTAPKFTGIMGS